MRPSLQDAVRFGNIPAKTNEGRLETAFEAVTGKVARSIHLQTCADFALGLPDVGDGVHREVRKTRLAFEQ
jgi:hypothetical protein